jgi:hypothetical protein
VLRGPAEPPEDKTVEGKGLPEALPTNVEELVRGNGVLVNPPGMDSLDDVGLLALVAVELRPGKADELVMEE